MLGYHGHAVRVSYPHFIRFTVSLDDVPCLPVCTGGNIALKHAEDWKFQGYDCLLWCRVISSTHSNAISQLTCRVEKCRQIH
jgi:hypothetical protein